MENPPIKGKGFWVWNDHHLIRRIDRMSDDGLRLALHDRGAEFVAGRIEFIFLKVANDTYVQNDLLTQAIAEEFKVYGIDVIPWVYVCNYSDEDLASFRAKPVKGYRSLGPVTTWQEAMDRQAAIHIDRWRMLGEPPLFVANCERGVWNLRGRSKDAKKESVPTYIEQIQRYLFALKEVIPNVAVSGYGRVANKVRRYPLVEMMEVADIAMPQWYWDENGMDPDECFTEFGAEWRRYTHGKPIVPSGGCWQDKDKEDGEWIRHWHSPDEIRRFLDLSKAFGAPWCAFWAYFAKPRSKLRVSEEQLRAIYDYDW